MKKIVVDAFEDPSRPQGGHAVILLRGLSEMPERPSIRLRPVEAGMGGEVRGLWRGARLEPLAIRATSQGMELVVGPDVVGHPQLLSGTPVIIEVPEAEVRGEFLWPCVAPLAQPRRRHVVVPRAPRPVVPHPVAANDDPPLSGSGPAHRSLAHDADQGAPIEVAASLGTAPAVAGNLAIRSDLDPAATAETVASSAMPSPAEGTAAAAAADTTPSTVADPVSSANNPPDAVPAPAVAVPADAAGYAPPARTSTIDLEPTRASEIGLPQWKPEARSSKPKVYAGIAAALALLVGYTMMPRKRVVDPDFPVIAETSRTQPGKSGGSGAPPAGPGTKSGQQPRDGNGPVAAAAGPAAVAAKPAPAACDAPKIETEALPAGRMRVAVQAPCQAGKDVHFIYSGADVLRRPDANGALTFVLDAFAGDSQPLEISLADGSRQTVPVKAKDLDRVSKVAVIWRAPVNLDLHAFEYAALPGGKGHVWSGAAGSQDSAAAAVSAERRGHGFLATVSDGRDNGDKVEVYTFLHADEQTGGTVGLAIDHATRGEIPAEMTCGKGPLAEVAYSLVVLSRGTPPRREGGLIAAAPCGAKLGPEIRFNQSALPPLKIRK